MADDCIFCAIVRGEIPSAKVYEDELTYAFLDLNPLTRGHSLVIPKEHHADILDIPKDLMAEVSKAAKLVAAAAKEGLAADGINLLHASGAAAEQSVFHFHIHVVPRYADDHIHPFPRPRYREDDPQGTVASIAKALGGVLDP